MYFGHGWLEEKPPACFGKELVGKAGRSVWVDKHLHFPSPASGTALSTARSTFRDMARESLEQGTSGLGTGNGEEISSGKKMSHSAINVSATRSQTVLLGPRQQGHRAETDLRSPAPCQWIRHTYHSLKLLKKTHFEFKWMFPRHCSQNKHLCWSNNKENQVLRRKINTRKLRQEHGKSKATWKTLPQKTKTGQGKRLVGTESATKAWGSERTKQGVAAHICNANNMPTARWDTETEKEKLQECWAQPAICRAK